VRASSAASRLVARLTGTGRSLTVREDQRAAQAHAELETLGMTSIGSDRLRHLGRAAGAGQPDVSELCGSYNG
jgi:hypothetical protein